MGNTFKIKNLMKRKRTGETTFKTEKMMDRKCGAIDDKVDKLEALRRAEKEIMKEIEDLTE
jgi:hypothetical protein